MALPASAEQAAAPPGRITLEVQTVNGSGCPAGSASVAAAADNTAFTVTYSEFTAAAGPAAKPTDLRKNCQINVLVSVPQGFTYAIAKAEYRGYARLAPGASGSQLASYYFTGDSATARSEHDLSGPLSGGWQATDAVEVGALVWAPCGVQTNLNINAELRADAGDSGTTAVVSMTRTEASARTLFHLSWKTCD